MTDIRKTLASRADELLQAAFEGCMEVLKDPKAQPTAKASSTGSAIRLFELLKGDAPSGKEPSEMSYDEIQASIGQYRRRASEIQASIGQYRREADEVED